MKRFAKPMVFSLLLALLVVGFVELALGLLVPASSDSPTVPDARLGHRPNPSHPEHDRKGFRNPEVPAKVRVVALGDSQTYGTGVKPEEAWPRQLASLGKQTVYSLAYGGYGPTHSLLLWDEAVALSPDIVIEAVYAGNDLFDSFHHVHISDQLRELKSVDASLQERIRAAEQAEPLATRVSRIYAKGIKLPGAVATPQGFLAQHSNLYALLSRTKHEVARVSKSEQQMQEDVWRGAKGLAAAHPDFYELLDDGKFRTVFTSAYRHLALDLDDPRIFEGLQITLRALQVMNERAAKGKQRLVVLLIPTKESVFRKLAQNPSAVYGKLTANEERFWALVQDMLRQNGIPYVNLLPVLQDQLAAGIQPYPVSHDGHPNRDGHRAIARAVACHLDQSGAKCSL